MPYPLYQSYEEGEVYCACDARAVLDVDVGYVLCGALDEGLGDDGRHVQLRLRCHRCRGGGCACIEVVWGWIWIVTSGNEAT